MKPSRYNHIIRRRNQPQLLYNSRQHVFLDMDNGQAAIFNGLSLPFTYNLINQKDPPVAVLISKLVENGFMVDDHLDELKELEVLGHLYRFDRSRLDLWINLSTRCDQLCPDCPYDASRSDLSETAQETIYRIIAQRIPGIKTLQIYWWGGEPALAWDLAKKIDQRIAGMAEQYGFAYSYQTITNGSSQHLKAIDDLVRPNELYVNLESAHLDKLSDQPRVLLGTIQQALKNRYRLPAGSRIRLIKNSPGPKLCRNVNQLCRSAPNLEDEEIEHIQSLLDSGLAVDNLPNPKMVACQAVDPQSFIIDVAGNIYKCWEDLGSPGKSLNGKIDQPLDPQVFRWLDWNPYHEAHCRLCNIFPWCLGGCRAKPPDVDCSMWHYALREMLALSAQANKNGAL